VDVRVIAASNLDPLAAIASGALREDLYYRLNVISLALEPLRARREDIPVLADFFIHSYNTQFGKQIVSVSDAAMQALIRYDWPGNVRQLKYVLESVIIFSEKDVIDWEDLPAFLGLCDAAKQTDVSGENVQKPTFASNNNETNPNLVPLGPLKMAVEAFEKNLIFQALCTSKGNIAEAARLLQLPKQTLYNKILRHGITLEVVALSNEH
jgi:arginine utilization regulatory protein